MNSTDSTRSFWFFPGLASQPTTTRHGEEGFSRRFEGGVRGIVQFHGLQRPNVCCSSSNGIREGKRGPTKRINANLSVRRAQSMARHRPHLSGGTTSRLLTRSILLHPLPPILSSSLELNPPGYMYTRDIRFEHTSSTRANDAASFDSRIFMISDEF